MCTTYLWFLVVQISAVDKERRPDALPPQRVQDGGRALVGAVVEREVDHRGALHSEVKRKKKIRHYVTPWCQNSPLSPYSVKWQGYFFSLLMATELAPRGKEVPENDYSRIVVSVSKPRGMTHCCYSQFRLSVSKEMGMWVILP